MASSFHCQAYLFNDYWEDIGTIKSFFDANLALTEQVGMTVAQVTFSQLSFEKILLQLIFE